MLRSCRHLLSLVALVGFPEITVPFPAFAVSEFLINMDEWLRMVVYSFRMSIFFFERKLRRMQYWRFVAVN